MTSTAFTSVGVDIDATVSQLLRFADAAVVPRPTSTCLIVERQDEESELGSPSEVMELPLEVMESPLEVMESSSEVMELPLEVMEDDFVLVDDFSYALCDNVSEH
jgi:hypothetical protein